MAVYTSAAEQDVRATFCSAYAHDTSSPALIELPNELRDFLANDSHPLSIRGATQFLSRIGDSVAKPASFILVVPPHFPNHDATS
jgi:hypothetical protein